MKKRGFSFTLAFGLSLFFLETFAISEGSIPQIHESIQVGELTRTYSLYRPPGWDTLKNMPLVLVLHGLGGDAVNTEQLTGFQSIAAKERFMLAYPEGINRQWNDGRGRNPFINDLGFIESLVNFLNSEYKVDTNRVYVAGMSNGGFMALQLACELPGKFAAFAAVAATVDSAVEANSEKSSPVSVMIIQGTKDRLVPINGGVVKRLPHSVILSHNAAIRAFVRRNNCDSIPDCAQLPGLYHDGTSVIKSTYANGKNGSEVIGFVIHNAGHTWPGGYQYLPVFFIGKTSRNLKASEAIWEFFKRHKKVLHKVSDI